MSTQKLALDAKQKGNKQFTQNNFQKAIHHYNNAIEIISNDTTLDKKQLSILYSNLAACHIRLNQFTPAIATSSQSLEYDESNIKSRYFRAKANEQLFNYQSSIDDLQHLLQQHPNHNASQDLLKIVQQNLKSHNNVRKIPTIDRQSRSQTRRHNRLCRRAAVGSVDEISKISVSNSKTAGYKSKIMSLERKLDETEYKQQTQSILHGLVFRYISFLYVPISIFFVLCLINKNHQ